MYLLIQLKVFFLQNCFYNSPLIDAMMLHQTLIYLPTVQVSLFSTLLNHRQKQTTESNEEYYRICTTIAKKIISY